MYPAYCLAHGAQELISLCVLLNRADRREGGEGRDEWWEQVNCRGTGLSCGGGVMSTNPLYSTGCTLSTGEANEFEFRGKPGLQTYLVRNVFAGRIPALFPLFTFHFDYLLRLLNWYSGLERKKDCSHHPFSISLYPRPSPSKLFSIPSHIDKTFLQLLAPKDLKMIFIHKNIF